MRQIYTGKKQQQQQVENENAPTSGKILNHHHNHIAQQFTPCNVNKKTHNSINKMGTTEGENSNNFFRLSDLTCLLSTLLVSISYYNYHEVRQSLHNFNTSLNITGSCCGHDGQALIFNRVPKVGSQTINNLVGILRERNGFNGYTSLEGMPEMGEGETVFLSEKNMRGMAVRALAEQATPYAFLKHQNFFDFAEFGYPSPIYMNFVRHPVERIISWHYYIRSPWYQVTVKEMKMTLEECLVLGFPGCVFRDNMPIHGNRLLPSHASQMTFFCGHGPDCNAFNSERLYQKAVENVEKYFAVVGVLEDWDMSLEVLESYIPRFFAGSRKVFSENEHIRHVNKNIYKPVIEERVKAMIARNMSREIEFYDFCRQRLRKQYLALQPTSWLL